MCKVARKPNAEAACILRITFLCDHYSIKYALMIHLAMGLIDGIKMLSPLSARRSLPLRREKQKI